MSDELYRFVFDAGVDKALKNLERLDAGLTKTQIGILKTAGMLKTLGQNSPGVTLMIGSLRKLDAELQSKVRDSTAAEAALKKVGQGNTAVTSLTKRLGAAEAALKRVTVAGNEAGTSLQGVGQNVKLPGGGAGGGGGAGFIASAARGMGAMAGRAILRGSIGSVKEGLQDRVGFFADAAEKSTQFRESLREYASLRGKKGPDDSIVNEAVDFAKKGSVLPEEITPFLTNYEGSAATGRLKGNIGGNVGWNGFTKEKQEALEAELKVTGAQFATRTGLDAKTAGDLTGVVSTYKKLNSAKDLAGQLGGMHYGLDQGRGEITPLARSELGQAGSNIESGRVSGLPELGAFIGVASVAAKTAGSAGTTYGQASRLLNESGANDETQAQFIKDSGIGDSKGDFNKLKALRDHLAKVKPADANSYLESMGYGNSTDRRSVLGMVGNVDVLEDRIKEANRRAANGQETIDANRANQHEQSSVNRQAEVDEFASTIKTGVTGERLRAAEAKARARLGDPNQPGGQRLKAGPVQSVKDYIKSGIAMGAVSGEDIRVGVEANQALERGGSQAGVDVRKKYGQALYEFSNPESRQKAFAAASEEVINAGGDPFGGPVRDAAKAARNLANMLDRLKPPPQQGGNPGNGVVPLRK